MIEKEPPRECKRCGKKCYARELCIECKMTKKRGCIGYTIRRRRKKNAQAKNSM